MECHWEDTAACLTNGMILHVCYSAARAEGCHPSGGIRKGARNIDKESKKLSGVLSTAKAALALYSDPLVARNTSASYFIIDDLVN